MENNNMQMMYKIFKIMYMMQESNNQDNYNSNQFRPYSNNYEMERDSMSLPMKWMKKMDMYDNNNMDVMQARSDVPINARLNKLEALVNNMRFRNNKWGNMYNLFDDDNSEYSMYK